MVNAKNFQQFDQKVNLPSNLNNENLLVEVYWKPFLVYYINNIALLTFVFYPNKAFHKIT